MPHLSRPGSAYCDVIYDHLELDCTIFVFLYHDARGIALRVADWLVDFSLTVCTVGSQSL